MAQNGHAVPSSECLLLRAKRTLPGYRFWSVHGPVSGSHSSDLNPVKVEVPEYQNGLVRGPLVFELNGGAQKIAAGAVNPNFARGGRSTFADPDSTPATNKRPL